MSDEELSRLRRAAFEGGLHEARRLVAYLERMQSGDEIPPCPPCHPDTDTRAAFRACEWKPGQATRALNALSRACTTRYSGQFHSGATVFSARDPWPTTLRDVSDYSESEILAPTRSGPTVVAFVRRVLKSAGLELAQQSAAVRRVLDDILRAVEQMRTFQDTADVPGHRGRLVIEPGNERAAEAIQRALAPGFELVRRRDLEHP